MGGLVPFLWRATVTTDIQPVPADSLGFGFVVPVTVHFDELDAFGMLHNARYPLLMERAWSTYWQEEGFDFTGDRAVEADSFSVVRELRVTYEVPVNRIGRYAAHIWLERLGNTAVTYGFRLCSADGAVTYAHGTRVLVHLDPVTLSPSPFSERFRSLARKLLRPES
jgi:acyl-CoA thioester hydrolase